MTDTEIDTAATLADVAAALHELAVALRPAITPATRPTWNQQRWAPGPEAFGPVPFAAVNPDGSPGNVVPDELIESAWGNAVVERVNTMRGVGLTQSGQLVANGASADWSFDAEAFDTDNYHNAGSSVVTIPASRDGSYAMTAKFHTSAVVGGGPVQVSIYNGAALDVSGFVMVGQNLGFAVSVNSLPAGRTLRVNLYNGSAAPLYIDGSFVVLRLGP